MFKGLRDDVLMDDGFPRYSWIKLEREANLLDGDDDESCHTALCQISVHLLKPLKDYLNNDSIFFIIFI